MKKAVPNESLDQIFRAARTYYGWLPDALSESQIRELYDLFKWGPTSSNSSPARFVWVRSPEAKAKLAEAAMEKNRPKILAAPVTVIIGNALDFAENLPKLVPAAYVLPMSKFFADPKVAEVSAMRNASLQGAYLMLAARALGIDCGPMSGFDSKAVDDNFFSGTNIRSNFICSLGSGDPASIQPRMGRLTFEEAGHFE